MAPEVVASSLAQAGVPSEKTKEVEKKVDSAVVTEFGGPVGSAIIMVFSHVLMLYLWMSIQYYDGSLFYPTSLSDVVPFAKRFVENVIQGASPTWYAVKIYWGFMLMQAALAVTMPGVWSYGLPVPSEGNVKHPYLCNGVWSFYITMIVLAGLHYTGIWRLTEVMENYGPLTTVSMLSGDITAVGSYVAAKILGKAHRMSGNLVYDYFMGAYLNPRIGYFDLKFWAELRVAWIMLFLLTLSAAVKQYEVLGYVTTPMLFMCLAHFLYVNACMKGEECVVTTWDVFYEKWGWMLIYWNFSGVPFVYCWNSIYLYKNGPVTHSTLYNVVCFAILLFAYYVWDTTNSQKNRFRMMLAGTYKPRRTFPQLPWGTLHNPKYLKTECGSLLLIDGWYQFCRKPHYTADVLMALSWGLVCGFNHFLPWFYLCFFTGMIIHRNNRDVERCERKYGKDWEKYCSIVKYQFIPGVF